MRTFYYLERPFTDVHLPCRNHAAHFEKAKTAFEEGAGNDEIEVDEFPMDKFRLSDDEDKMSISHISHT